MIRARAGTNGNATASTTKRIVATSGSKRKDVRRGGGNNTSSVVIIFVVSMVLFMIVYCMAGFYAVLHVDVPIHQKTSLNQPAGRASQVAISANKAKNQASRKFLSEIRSTFNERYNVVDENDGRSVLDGAGLLEKGLHSFGSIDDTARRILEASEAQRPFVMAFSGYSITVGRGNFFNQSFPFVAGGILEKPMQQIFGIPLTVRNAAIGGIPSFPYGFCLEHFLGSDPDVISWDYSMNEGGRDASILEAFVRQATAQLPKRPMIIMVDTNGLRMNTLDEYTHRGWLKDAIAIGKKDVLNEKEIFGDKSNPTPEEKLPVGFQNWNEFGSVS
jgi:flagellar basal body-associated protein FliL